MVLWGQSAVHALLYASVSIVPRLTISWNGVMYEQEKHKLKSAFLTPSKISAMGNFQEQLALPCPSHVCPRETEGGDLLESVRVICPSLAVCQFGKPVNQSQPA